MQDFDIEFYEICEIIGKIESELNCEKCFVYYITDNGFIDLEKNFLIEENFQDVMKNSSKLLKNFNACNTIILRDKNNHAIGLVYLCNHDKEFSQQDIEKIYPQLGLIKLMIERKLLQNKFEQFVNNNNGQELFLANVSHEIRTPLHGIVGYNQLLLRTDLNEVQKSHALSLNKCSIQLMQIINDILDFSKLASGKMSIINECFNIKDIISLVKDALDQRIKEKKQHYDFIIDYNVPKYIISDKQKIVQIIINLLSNAVKFTNIGGKISVNICDDINNTLKISVKDNGVGILEEEQHKLFSPFSQIDKSCGGTGLGLVICKRLVELLGGQIYVKSSYGNGSEFIFTITYQSHDKMTQKMQENVNMDILINKVVLLVDDNVNNRIILDQMLFDEWRMTTIVCASGVEALRVIRRGDKKIDLGLIDICMPEMSGTDLARDIKKYKPFLPLIALSSLDEGIDGISGEFFDQKLEKPINKLQLFSSIYRIVSENLSSDDDTINSTPEISDIKVLIVDDVMSNLELLNAMLQELGFSNIDKCSSGKNAIEKLSSEKYNVLFLDLRMPVTSGFDVIDHINNHNIKVITVVLTASILDKDKNQCAKNNIKYFVTKPVQLKQLKKVMLLVKNDL